MTVFITYGSAYLYDSFEYGFDFHPSGGAKRILDFQVVEQSEDLSKFGMTWDTVLEVTAIDDRDRFPFL